MTRGQDQPPRDSAGQGAARPGFLTLLAVSGLSIALGFSAVYLTGARSDKVVTPEGPARTASVEPAAQQPGAEAAAAKPDAAPPPAGSAVNPLSTGKMTAFVFKKTPEPVPEVSFSDAEGKTMTLADFKGKSVLLNVWATWCAPCRKEMPDLDQLQKEMGSDKFQVVALSVDRQGIDVARKFFDSIKIENLALYIDSSARASSALRVVGMPTTILIDAQGREVGRLVGPAEWHSDDAKKLIAASLQ